MLQIGVTGGIGSGKTTVCAIFEVLRIPVYYADNAAKYLMEHDQKLVGEVKLMFGDNIYNMGKLDRKAVAKQVFVNKEMLVRLNAAVHPVVLEDYAKWVQRQDAPYVIKEAALLFETGSYKQLDKTIAVVADVDLRIQRLLQRDHTTKEAIEARMANQWPDEKKTAHADFVVENNPTNMLLPQVLDIHKKLRNVK